MGEVLCDLAKGLATETFPFIPQSTPATQRNAKTWRTLAVCISRAGGTRTHNQQIMSLLL